MRSALRSSSFSQARRHGCLIVYDVGLFNVYDVQRKRIEPATEHTEEYLCCRDSAVVTDRCEVDQIPLAIARRAWTTHVIVWLAQVTSYFSTTTRTKLDKAQE